MNDSGLQCQADNVGITEENNCRGQGPPVCSLQLSPLACLPPPGSVRPKVKPEGTQMSHNWESRRGVETTVGWLATQVWSSKERSGQKYMGHQRKSSGWDEPQDSPRFPYYTAPRTLPQHNYCHIIPYHSYLFKVCFHAGLQADGGSGCFFLISYHSSHPTVGSAHRKQFLNGRIKEGAKP